MHDCLIAFGSNEGSPQDVYQAALDRLEQSVQVEVVANSKPFETSPVGGPEGQGNYLNAAIRIATELEPDQLHQQLVAIENELGRQRRTRWGSRKIDLDLLLFDELEFNSERLTVPHPRMSFRRFVLEPAGEIAGEMIHPPSGLSMAQLLTNLEQRKDLVLGVYDERFSVFFDEIGSEVADHHPAWSFRVVPGLDEWEQYVDQAKLVTYFVMDDHGSAPVSDSARGAKALRLAAREFAGATLRLPKEADRALTEILAAIDGMQA